MAIQRAPEVVHSSMTIENRNRDPTGTDAYSPSEMATRVERAGVTKVHLPVLPLLALSVLAGVFIAFGGMFYTLAITGSGFGFGLNRLLGGLAFSLGLVLVIVGGAELFTGNSLIVMAWASRRITLSALLRNWAIVYAGNFAGALGMGRAGLPFGDPIGRYGRVRRNGASYCQNQAGTTRGPGVRSRRAVQRARLPCGLVVLCGS